MIFTSLKATLHLPLLLLALASSGVAYWQYSSANRAKAQVAELTASLRSAQAGAKADRAASAKRAIIIKRLKAEKAVNDAKLQAALAASPEWAAGRVPDAVLDSVR